MIFFMAKMKYWDGTTWEILDAKDADTVDGKHFTDIQNDAQTKADKAEQNAKAHTDQQITLVTTALSDIETNVGNVETEIASLNDRLGTNENNLTTHLADYVKHLQMGERESWNNLVKVKKNVTILASGWIDDTAASGFWIYEIEDEDITENTMVDVNIDVNDLEKASGIKSVTDSFDGYVRIYADEQLTEDIVADIRLIRQVVVNEG